MTPTAPTTEIVRCSACGHPVGIPMPSRCTLCDAPLLEKSPQGSDVTPYAERFARDEPGRPAMNNWVWFAGPHRLRHLASMRGSAASRSFARGNLFVLATCLAFLQATQAGWRIEATSSRRGDGGPPARHVTWFHLVETGVGENSPKAAEQGDTEAADLWWSPVQSGFAAVHAFIVGIFACLIAHWLVRAGTAVSLAAGGKDGPPMTAALHYGTAWIVPLIAATVVVSLRPIAYLGEAQQWSWQPSSQGLDLTASVVAVFAGVMWWFWLIRLGTATARNVRGRVVSFFAVGVPVIAGAAGLAWYVGVRALNRIMFNFMGITF